MNGLSGNVSKTSRRLSNTSEKTANMSGTVSNKKGRTYNKPGYTSDREEESHIFWEWSHTCQEGCQIHEEETCMSKRVSNTWRGGGSTSSGRVSKMCLKYDRKCSQERGSI